MSFKINYLTHNQNSIGFDIKILTDNNIRIINSESIRELDYVWVRNIITKQKIKREKANMKLYIKILSRK
jgi:hypothetical protein